jgi:hypothetical protein
MGATNPNTAWLETLFDVSEPYLYVLILPTLILVALGYRTQAVMFALGAAVLLFVTGIL